MWEEEICVGTVEALAELTATTALEKEVLAAGPVLRGQRQIFKEVHTAHKDWFAH